MTAYIIRRILGILPVLFLISVIVFTLTALIPGDPATVILGTMATPERVAATQARLGLDQPIYVRYLLWLSAILQGDLGTSVLDRQSVLLHLQRTIPVTLELMLFSMIFAVVTALLIGIVAAIRRGTLLDRFLMTFVLIGVSIPGFWLGLMLILVFAVRFKLLPPSGYVSFTVAPWQNLIGMILPSLTLGIYLAPPLARFVRSGMLEVLGQEYIRTAWSKGLNEYRVISRHALKNALIPVVTFIGLQMGSILAGAIVTEAIFGLPGTGRLAMSSILSRDYPMIQGVVLFVALGYTFINLIVDVLYAFLNPRIRFGG
jgi:peptide/nickel transport system permease protein